ncbi:hypothetical protein EXIGLDRAFT_678894 [Exidia glandulosa HHB12029]|uniref:Uncharacterized protein n=1 Tax=Exidia glandulosa HHB12029 TaxID=1314781 RepID=A0A165F6Y7_EXIGL|nr:hypothetical protein EXIGLDRAFT_678894 [Exidia glandulosa HHB12029]
MKFSALVAALAIAPLALAVALPEPVDERALPEGHPILGAEDFPANYTFGPDVWPEGFTAPTQTITALPAGYSLGPEAVYGPDGKPITAFPEAALASVTADSSAVHLGVSSLLAVGAAALGLALF